MPSDPPDEDRLSAPPDSPRRRGGFRPRRRSRRRRVGFASAFALAVLLLGALVLRTQWFAAQVAARVGAATRAATGLELRYARVGFNLWRFSVRIEGVDVWRPGTARLLRVDALEVGVSPYDVVRGDARPTSIAVDGADLDLRFERRNGAVSLVNGPVSRGGGGSGSSELPFRDLAVSDVRLRVTHPDLGTLALRDVDVDVLNRPGQPLRVGLLVGGGEVQTRWFTGPVRRIEARLATRLDLSNPDLEVASAAVSLGAAKSETAAQVRAASLKRGPDGHLRLVADARVSTRIETVLRAIPDAPAIEGTAAVDAQAEVDLDAGTFRATATVDGADVGLFNRDGTTQEIIRYSLVERAHLRCEVTPDAARCGDVDLGYAGARLRSERITVTDLLHRPAIAGRIRLDNLDFPRLMGDTTVTPRTKVLWNISGDLDLRGTLAPLDLDIGLRDMDTRDFAVLQDYHQVLPRRPVVAIPRARLNGRMRVRGPHMSWEDITATFGQSTLHARKVAIRLSHDPTHRERDFVIEGLRAPRLHLADLDRIADLPVRGDATLTVHLNSDFDDVVLGGTARFEDFSITGLPFGTLETDGEEWRMRGVRVEIPRLRARYRQSDYQVFAGYLDFSRYTLTAGAAVSSNRLQLQDFYHMFHFEGDPTFEPFDGSAAVNARVEYVLGRPGDDRDGVMTVKMEAHNGDITAYGERFQNVSAALSYDWLRRREGVRGASVRLDRFAARKGAGTVEIAGTMDPGARMHFTATARDLSLDTFDALQPQTPGASPIARGSLGALVTVGGTPDAPRVSASVQLGQLVALGRPLGAIAAEITQTPTSTFLPPNLDVSPPPSRLGVRLNALNDLVRVRATLDTPWRVASWRDGAGESHRTWNRAWGESLASGSLSLAQPMDLLPWLPPALLARLGDDRRARVKARVDVTHARLDQLSRASFVARVEEVDLHAYGVPLALSPGAQLVAQCCEGLCEVSDGRREARCPDRARLGVHDARTRFNDSQALLLGPEGTRLWLGGLVSVDESLHVVAMDVATRGDADLERLAAAVPGVLSARGDARLDVSISGDQRAPDYAGEITLRRGALRLTSEYVPPLSDIDVTISLARDQLRIDRFRALAGAGLVDLSGGTARLQGLGVERYSVPVSVQGLAFSPIEGLDVTLDADLNVSGGPTGEPALVQGPVALRRVNYTRPIATSLDVLGGRGARAESSGNNERPYDPANDFARFDIQLLTQAPMRIANNLMDAEIVIGRDREFRVVGTNQRWGLVGSLEVPRGLLRLYSNEFEVRRARIEFDDPERVDPVFDLLAQTEVRRTGDSNRSQWRIALHGYGSTRSGLNLDMSAEPALSREDILFLLLFRATRAELERLGTNAGQAIGIEALWLLSGLDRRVTEAIPVIDEFRVGSTYNPRTNATEPQLTIGRGIGERVRVGGSVSASAQPLTRVTLDLRVNQEAGVQFVGENVGNQLGTVSINIGADFRWRLEFQ